jgi:hypothetical protein
VSDKDVTGHTTQGQAGFIKKVAALQVSSEKLYDRRIERCKNEFGEVNARCADRAYRGYYELRLNETRRLLRNLSAQVGPMCSEAITLAFPPTKDEFPVSVRDLRDMTRTCAREASNHR